MADNVTIPATGTGTATPVVATDDVTGVHYQKVKLDLGGDGASAPVSGSVPTSGDTAHDAVDAGNPLKMGGKANDAAPTQVSANGDRVDARFDRRGAQFVRLTDSAGADLPTGVQYVEDSALGATGQGTLVVGRRDDALATLTEVENDAVGLRVNSRGALWVNQDQALPTGTNNIGDVDVLTLPGVAGDTAHDVADAGNPVKIGGKASATNPTAVADADRVNAFLGLLGEQMIGAGPGWDRESTDTFTATSQNGADIDCSGSGAVLIDLKGTSLTTATFVLEYSTDGTNWFSPSSSFLSLTDSLWVTASSYTITVDKRLIARTAGVRKIRIRTTGTFTATNVVATYTVTHNSPLDKAQDIGPAPHNIGYDITGKTAQYTTAQTGVALWTPASGKRLVITSYQIQAGGTVAGTVQVWFGASADTTYTRGTDLAVFDGEFAPSATLKPGAIQTGVWKASAVDHILRVTDSAAINPLTITCWGFEA